MFTNKPSNTTRIFFVNVNGLQFGSLGGEFTEVCSQMNEANIDILGLAESKLDTQKRNRRHMRSCSTPNLLVLADSFIQQCHHIQQSLQTRGDRSSNRRKHHQTHYHHH
jgi:hypothetical protein